MRASSFLLVTALLAPAFAHAKDLGVQGTVWPIIERDMRELVLESAARADWGQAQADLKESANTYFDRLPQHRLPLPLQTRTRWIDPSITLDSDIRVPEKQADGSFAWKVLYKAGTRVNPLAYAAPNTAMFFFDGTQDEQRALVKQLVSKYPAKIRPVEVSGANVRDISEELGFPVFYGSSELLSRFQISAAPSLLFAGSGSHSLYLGIAEFARPFSTSAVESVIPQLLTPRVALPTTGASK